MHSYKFIVNPVAGNGKANKLLPVIKERFKNAGVDFDIYLTRRPGDAIEAAAKGAREGFSVMVAVGGDGTVNEVLNGIVGTEARLAALPGGKGNDFATAVQMSRDIESACDDLLRAEIKKIDLGRVLGRYFINSVGVGFDAAVAQRANRGVKFFNGVSAYVYAFFETLFTYEFVEAEIDLGNGAVRTTPILVAVGIGQAYGGGMRIVPDAIQDDGLFDICVFEKISRPEMVYHFPKVFSGKLKHVKHAGMFRAREVKLSLNKKRPLHMEGEIFVGDEMHFTLQQRAIPVITGTNRR